MVSSPVSAFSPVAAFPRGPVSALPAMPWTPLPATPADAFAPVSRPAAAAAPAGYQRIGEILSGAGLVNGQDVQAALMQQQFTREPLGQILLRAGKITPQQLDGALGYQQQLVRQLQAQGQAPAPSAAANPMLDLMIINQALQRLLRIQNPPQDEAYIRHMGVNPPFRNGSEALQLILGRHIRVAFGDMGDSPAHAQWVADQNLIMINQRYRGDTAPATIYAIAEAIYHEAGHAAGNGDNESSIQEELDCLSLNTLAHRYHEAIDPAYAQTASTSRLIADGVALYARLFFDPDPAKQALVNRVVQKYGDLPLWSPGHMVPPPVNPRPLAYRVAEQIDANNVARGVMPPSSALGQNAGLMPAALPAPQAIAPRLSYTA